jgi:hypothetical protein
MRRPAALLLLLALGCRADPPPAAPLAAEPVEAEGLHNVYRVTDRVYSGSSPDGEAGFRSHQSLGVRTVLSVDGSTPDVATARRFGLRYVHLPVGYDGITEARAAQIAAAVRDLPGPVYVHCHHGKHRGPAAVAVAVRGLDPRCTADHAVAFLKQVGTDPRYAGLYAAAERPPVPPGDGPLDFPEVAPVADLTRLMVEIDDRWDRLKEAAAAGWTSPAESAHDAVLLREHYREAARLSDPRPEGYRKLLAEAEAAAGELESALRAGTPADGPFRASAALCGKCHAAYRDR